MYQRRLLGLRQSPLGVLLRFQRLLVFSDDLGPALPSFIRVYFDSVSTMEERCRSLPEGGDVREQAFHGSPRGDETSPLLES